MTDDKGCAGKTKEVSIMSVAKYNGYWENNEDRIGDCVEVRGGMVGEGCAPSRFLRSIFPTTGPKLATLASGFAHRYDASTKS